MNFQMFCKNAEKIDQQKVVTNNTFVISFRNTKGELFSIDPSDIVHFLEYVNDNYKDIENAWNSVVSKKDLLTKYEEKSYREIYKLAGSKEELKSIGSTGRSQTRALTMVISKMICYLSQLPYVSILENTYFDKETIKKALSRVPDNLSDLGRDIPSKNHEGKVKARFVKWMKGKKLSDRTIYSYAETGMNTTDKILDEHINEFEGIYSLTQTSELDAIIEKLNTLDEWKEINASGNGMYQAGLKKYEDFLKDARNKSTASIIHLTLPKPFILLAGISGTGKTRFVREQAIAFDAEKNNYCLVSVRPDWHEPSDLLGYVSRLSGTPKYISTKVLNFIVKAWQVVAPDATQDGTGELDYDAVPYWLCLDEMNLAPVEQYFADYLSVLESREFSDDSYKCEALLDKGLLQDLATNDAEIQKTLGLEDNDDLWQYFLNHGIAIPPNLIVAGTVNMDETTHGFSRKVIDRALTIDFGEFFPNDYVNYFQQKTRPKCFSYSKQSQASQDNLAETFDVDGSKSIAFLSSVNDILKHTPFELAYRALNELLLQVECFKPETEEQLYAVWDDFLMSKVLPRIDGDEDKLRVKKDDDTVINLLEALSELLEVQLGDIWNGVRFDFYRENTDSSVIDDIPCRSKAKLIWMQNRLTTNTFTSFWP